MRNASLLCALALAACSTPTAPDDSATDAPVDTGPFDAGPVDGGGDGPPAFVHDGGYDDSGPITPFTGANETWQAVAIDGAHCGNGSPLMIGVNLTTRSNDVVIYFQGGGACWDYTTCFMFGTASHVTDTLTAADITSEATGGTSFLFERNAQNPFQNASYVYIPYCTGDAHAGTNVATFMDSSGGTHTMHFEGAHNTELVFERMAATRPTTTHVTLIGASAGGYGVLANWWRGQQIFSGARVDALSDSGLPLNVPGTRWRTFVANWGFNLPPDCPGCSQIGDAVPYYERTMQPPHRFGLLAFLDDSVIPGFYGASTAAIHQELLMLRTQTMTTPNMRTFYVNMSGHVLMQTPDTLTAGANGPTVRAWITQFATDDPAWTDVGP
jgi:hypothetical protein